MSKKFGNDIPTNSYSPPLKLSSDLGAKPFISTTGIPYSNSLNSNFRPKKNYLPNLIPESNEEDLNIISAGNKRSHRYNTPGTIPPLIRPSYDYSTPSLDTTAKSKSIPPLISTTLPDPLIPTHKFPQVPYSPPYIEPEDLKISQHRNLSNLINKKDIELEPKVELPHYPEAITPSIPKVTQSTSTFFSSFIQSDEDSDTPTFSFNTSTFNSFHSNYNGYQYNNFFKKKNSAYYSSYDDGDLFTTEKTYTETIIGKNNKFQFKSVFTKKEQSSYSPLSILNSLTSPYLPTQTASSILPFSSYTWPTINNINTPKMEAPFHSELLSLKSKTAQFPFTDPLSVIKKVIYDTISDSKINSQHQIPSSTTEKSETKSISEMKPTPEITFTSNAIELTWDVEEVKSNNNIKEYSLNPIANDKAKLHVEKKNDLLEYTIKEKDGSTLKGKISKEDLKQEIPESTEKLQMLLPKILKIINDQNKSRNEINSTEKIQPNETDFDELDQFPIYSIPMSLPRSYIYREQDNHDIKLNNKREDHTKKTIDASLEKIIQRLKNNDLSLIKLDLSGLNIELEQLRKICLALKTNTKVKSLKIENTLEEENLPMFLEILKTNTTLTHLIFKKNKISSNNIDFLTIKTLLKRNSLLSKPVIDPQELKKIDLTRLEQQDLERISARYKSNILDFSENGLEFNNIIKLNTAFQYFNFINILNLSKNNLNNVAMQELSGFLKINNTLTYLKLTYNQIGFNGAKEVLLAIKQKPQLNKLDLSHNWISVESSSEFKKLEDALPEDQDNEDKPKKLKINVSQNYFTTECTALLSRHTFFYSQGSYIVNQGKTKKLIQLSGFSIILPGTKIDYDNHLVFILRRLNGRDPQHAMILIEGMYENGQKYICTYDFRPDGPDGSLGKIEGKSFVPERMAVNGYEYLCRPTKRVNVEDLKTNIEKDQKRTLYYKKLPKGKTYCSPEKNIYNCLTWAIAKVNEIIPPNQEKIKEPNFLPIPSLYFWGNRVMQTHHSEKEPTKNQISDNSFS